MKKLCIKTLLVFFLTAFNSLHAQEKTITGTITDVTGVPLGGVTVLVKNTTNGTSTDFDGNYSLKVNKDAVLVLSYIGFVTQEITVSGKTVINVAMEEDLSQLDEVVVAMARN